MDRVSPAQFFTSVMSRVGFLQLNHAVRLLGIEA